MSVMERREFITLLGGGGGGLATRGVCPSIGQAPTDHISGRKPAPTAKVADAFIEGMRALGYTEGRDFEMEYRCAEGYLERLPALEPAENRMRDRMRWP